MDINLNSSNLTKLFLKMLDYLEDDDPMRVDFWDRDIKVGYAELSLREYNNEDAVEIRWIEIEPTERDKGYLRRIVNEISRIDNNSRRDNRTLFAPSLEKSRSRFRK